MTHPRIWNDSEDYVEFGNDQLVLGFSRLDKQGWYLSKLAASGTEARNWVAAEDHVTPLWKAKMLHERYLPPQKDAHNRWDWRLVVS